ncbi:unnamed protein product, partial [Iphiclides podalirius]
MSPGPSGQHAGLRNISCGHNNIALYIFRNLRRSARGYPIHDLFAVERVDSQLATAPLASPNTRPVAAPHATLDGRDATPPRLHSPPPPSPPTPTSPPTVTITSTIAIRDKFALPRLTAGPE